MEVFQSTHPRGVRPFSKYAQNYCLHFNPRTHEGCDPKLIIITTEGFVFQSTHPRGVRHDAAVETYGASSISIHAPTRGATPHNFDVIPCGFISIHAPTRGATFGRTRFIGDAENFNPRTHEGCDQGACTASYTIASYFNPRTHEGCDFSEERTAADSKVFQSTHPRGVRH